MQSPHLKYFLILTILALVASTSWAASGPQSDNLSRIIDQGVPVRLQNLLDHRTIALRDDGSSPIQQARLAGQRAPDALQAIIMMCDFSDSLMLGRHGVVEGDFPLPMQSEIYYASHDSVFFSHLFGDVADYYADVSAGAFTFNYTIHSRVVNLPNPMSYYGNHPENGEQTISLAAAVVDSLDGEIDFSLYDTYILIHAGAGEETDILGNSPEQIYSNFLDSDDFQQAFEDGELEFPYLPSSDFGSDEGINQVLILPECEYQDPVGGFGGYFGSLGVYCFEVGLRLGMLSLSDFTPAGRPDSQGIGEFGLMGYGLFVGMGWIPPHVCSYNKLLMGWLDPVEVDPLLAGDHFLTPCEMSGDAEAAMRVAISGQEYWLLAYRLQDPDGNRIFSFPGDLNGNNTPDFYDFDATDAEGNPTNDGVPLFGYAKFDPEFDTRERLSGAEWDFFMSENSARGPKDKGAGSGLYIWHIDEGVIQETFGMSSNRFNADADHKSVDLEEADGIQDLDSREPSPFILGGDDDSFRGEGASVFGPETLPNTASAGGAATNVRFGEISKVVNDSLDYIARIDYRYSPPDTTWGFDYADTIFFHLETVGAAGAGPELVARREFPAGTNLRGSHVLLANLGADVSLAEIIVTGHEGEIFVLDGDLNELIDQDGDPATMAPLAVGTFGNIPVPWNQPAAAGDFDGDGLAAEIILTGPRGLYVFNADGTELIPDAANTGLVVQTEFCALPPVLVPQDRNADFDETQPVDACVVFQEDGLSSLRLYSGPAAEMSLQFNLGPLHISSAPVYSWNNMVVAVHDTLLDESYLIFCNLQNEQILSLDLPVQPGIFPIQLGLVDPSLGTASDRYAIVPGINGQAQTLFFDEEMRAVSPTIVWDESLQIHSPLAPGGSFVGAGVLGRGSNNGAWFDGWPERPFNSFDASSDSFAGGPLVLNLPGDPTPIRQILYPVSDGRIFGMGLKGESIAGWPVSGPARNAGTPAVGWVTGGLSADLVAVGTFSRITGLNDDNSQLESVDISTLAVWDEVVGADPLWPMWGGSAWRNGSWNMSAWSAPSVAAQGSGLVPGSHICYPSPLGVEPLNVRGSVREASQVMAYVYNLQGEEVAFSQWQPAVAADPFTITLPLDNIASGMYLCRLVARSASGQEDSNVIPFAVER